MTPNFWTVVYTFGVYTCSIGWVPLWPQSETRCPNTKPQIKAALPLELLCAPSCHWHWLGWPGWTQSEPDPWGCRAQTLQWMRCSWCCVWGPVQCCKYNTDTGQVIKVTSLSEVNGNRWAGYLLNKHHAHGVIVIKQVCTHTSYVQDLSKFLWTCTGMILYLSQKGIDCCLCTIGDFTRGRSWGTEKRAFCTDITV